MTALHKERLAEQKGFLGWLEGYLHAPVESLTGKTRLKAYSDPEQCKGFEDFLGILVKNCRQFTDGAGKPRNPEGRDERAELEKQFTASLAKLAPILIQIERTDRLIDQIVYQLYGLTDDEIAIVEGREA